MRRLAALLLFVILLAGCSPGSDTVPMETSDLPQENLDAAYTASFGIWVFPSNNGRGVYVPQSVLYFFDFETEEKVVMCGQSGCLHNTPTCIAYLGGAEAFAEYHSEWYIIDGIDDEEIQIIKVNPAKEERTTLCTVSRDDADVLLYSYCSFAYGHAYLTLFAQRYMPDSTVESFDVLYRINLETGAYTEMFRIAGNESIYVCGASENSMLLVRNSISGEMLSEEEYAAAYGAEADYFDYWDKYYAENTATQLERYDFASGESSVLATEKEDGYIPPSGPNISYGNQVLCPMNDDLMIYDLSDNTSRILLTQKNIVNYWLLDGKAFYITLDDDIYSINYADLETGESTRLENNGNTDGMYFSISDETAEYFIGLCSDLEGKYWIEKTAFYADDYSNIKRLS